MSPPSIPTTSCWLGVVHPVPTTPSLPQLFWPQFSRSIKTARQSTFPFLTRVFAAEKAIGALTPLLSKAPSTSSSSRDGRWALLLWRKMS